MHDGYSAEGWVTVASLRSGCAGNPTDSAREWELGVGSPTGLCEGMGVGCG